MDFLNDWWGVKDNISVGEIAARAVVMFLLMVLFIRIFGMRPFGKGEAFDTVITILLGSVAARGIVGATPFIPTVVACISMILTHMVLSKLSFYNKMIGKQIKGKPSLLYSEGRFHKDNLESASITEHDIYEELRLTTQLNSLDGIQEIYIERTGEISFVKK